MYKYSQWYMGNKAKMSWESQRWIVQRRYGYNTHMQTHALGWFSKRSLECYNGPLRLMGCGFSAEARIVIIRRSLHFVRLCVYACFCLYKLSTTLWSPVCLSFILSSPSLFPFLWISNTHLTLQEAFLKENTSAFLLLFSSSHYLQSIHKFLKNKFKTF